MRGSALITRLALLLVVASRIVLAVTREHEVTALRSLYQSTGGDQWLWREDMRPNWNFSLPDADLNPCSDDGQVWEVGLTMHSLILFFSYVCIPFPHRLWYALNHPICAIPQILIVVF